MADTETPSPIEIRQSLTILASMDQPIYVSDRDNYEILYANATIKKLYGDIVGQLCYKALQQRDEPCPFCTNEYIFGRNEGKTYIWEFQSTANKRWYRCIDKAIPWTNGRMVRCEMAVDVTDFKRVSDDFNRLFDLSADLQCIIDFKGVIKRANPAVVKTFGHPFEDIVGRPFRDFIHPDDIEKSLAAFRKIITGEQIKQLEQRVRCKDGSFRYVLWVATPVREERVMYAVARDITERKHMEEELRISKERYKAVMENAGSAIMVSENDKSLYFVNNEFATLSGYSQEELIGKKKWTEFFRGDDLAKMIEIHRTRRIDPTTTPRNYTVTFFDRVGRGRTVYVTGSMIPGTKRSIGAFQDISELKKAEEELKTAKEHLEKQNEELKKLDRIKDGIIRDVSHELKTPVAKFSMQIEIMRAALMRHGLFAEFKKPFDTIEASISRQEQVIQNIMNLSRLEAGGRTYTYKPIRLDEVLKTAIGDYRTAFESVGMHLVLSLDPVTIHSDPAMLWHVFSNIFNNSLKYRKNSGENNLAISLSKTGKHAVVSIADNGIGMTPEDACRSFERFYQVASSIEGCGVGLPICKMIVEGLGGEISIESEGPGLGTTVTLKLPEFAAEK